MQINSNLPVLFTPVKPPEELSVRLPVVFDKQSEFNNVNRQPVISRPVIGVNDNNDSQQARFIRNFSLTNRETERDDTQARLPAQVQAYLQVEGLKDVQPQERLFDAMA
ncbi:MULTISPECIES: hypothetical protein [unclassified Methylophaga]|jgi:hypothetical protein|uniref:hypothetical protein n=2 Tax=Methylophaga TaxID=40222 RepID=UPI000C916AA7|nr:MULTISPECIES: hypothetical protein [unclassified Methylophaga]MAK66479.1 hypothetical protein [Methylophaga sp.]MAY17172.1 hypothetical protein [Methylophaga sp.]MBN46034.1 hypothetical protein [Methylophaga sp.]HAO24126.1 hypothetical protein [Methylophaga sp.]|tara:strand:+ start:1257 stop:1583 length:327 start_codon:yes stop_codon:yes gene_type:complete